MLRPLMLSTAVPALPAAVCIIVINEGIELSLPRTNPLQVFGAFWLLVLSVLLAVGGGYLVASGLARAGWLWAGYLAGLAVLMTVSALAPVLISRATVTGQLTCSAIPGELNCATAPGLILCFVGPLGFLGPLMLLPTTRRITGGRSGFSPTAAVRLATAALAVVCYEIAVGCACLWLITTAPDISLFLPVVLAANLLTTPAMVFIVSAALVTHAEAETGPVRPDSADCGG